MNQTRNILMALVIVAMLAALFACSDDDKTTTPVDLTQGELTDSQYLFADRFIQTDALDLAEISFTTSVYLLQNLSGPATAKAAPDWAASRDLIYATPTASDTPSFSAEGWYVFHFESAAYYQDVDLPASNVDSVISTGIDSVRLLLAGVPVEWSGTTPTFDKFEYRYRTQWESTNGMTGECIHRASAEVSSESTNFDKMNITIDDSEVDPYDDEGGFCYVVKHTTGSATGISLALQFNFPALSICVDSGKVDFSTVIALDCTEGAEAQSKGLEGLWRHIGDYDSTYVLTYKITHGSTFWLAADTCEL